ncbi:hypothetical protein D3C74_256000 [compost metagenome]
MIVGAISLSLSRFFICDPAMMRSGSKAKICSGFSSDTTAMSFNLSVKSGFFIVQVSTPTSEPPNATMFGAFVNATIRFGLAGISMGPFSDGYVTVSEAESVAAESFPFVPPAAFSVWVLAAESCLADSLPQAPARTAKAKIKGINSFFIRDSPCH